MKKSIMGFIALAMFTALTTAAQASIPDSDGISNGSPPGLIASSTENIAPATPALAGITTSAPALASVSMGTKGNSPRMAGIKTSSPALASIGGGSGDSKADPSWAQAQASPGGGFALMAREDEGIRLGLSGSPPGSRQVAG